MGKDRDALPGENVKKTVNFSDPEVCTLTDRHISSILRSANTLFADFAHMSYSQTQKVTLDLVTNCMMTLQRKSRSIQIKLIILKK